MRIFKCGSCDHTVFFESVQCERCGHTLAFLPDRGVIVSLVQEKDGNGLWRVEPPDSQGELYRLCRNYIEESACNWALPAEENQEYCRSCRLNHVIPDLSDAKARRAWHQIEIAKRRLLYTALGLGLPLETKQENPQNGLAFDFLKDGDEQVFTGHNDGLITINIAEADDPLREKIREELGEAYRTLLGHFRHESGHYYWMRLIANSPHLDDFRQLFGDEQQEYDEARARYYREGPPAQWWDSFVSAYATMHPWEDWAETWAHYLHMTDALETARDHGLSLRPSTSAPALSLATRRLNLHSFDDLIKGWIPLTVALNSLNRSFGMRDCYPFVLTPAAIQKLHFVHDVIEKLDTRTQE
jgi:hypothetical protein